jgi:hypothetical protein
VVAPRAYQSGSGCVSTYDTSALGLLETPEKGRRLATIYMTRKADNISTNRQLFYFT